MQLPFCGDPAGAVRVPIRTRWGNSRSSRPVAILAWVVAGIIVALNLKLLFDTLVG